MQVLVRLNGSRLGFSAFEVKVLDEHILFVDRYTTKMAFRGFCIGTLLLIYIYIYIYIYILHAYQHSTQYICT